MTNAEEAAMDLEAGKTGNVVSGQEVGHFVVVQMKGSRKNEEIDSIVGVYHFKSEADKFAATDRGLWVIEAETLR